MGGAQSTQRPKRRGSFFETSRQSLIKSEIKKIREEFMSKGLGIASWNNILDGIPSNPIEQHYFEQVSKLDPSNEHPNFPQVRTSSNTRKKIAASLRRYTEKHGNYTKPRSQTRSQTRSKSSSSETARPRLLGKTSNIELVPRNPQTGKFEK
jgi:hypothetical protein